MFCSERYTKFSAIKLPTHSAGVSNIFFDRSKTDPTDNIEERRIQENENTQVAQADVEPNRLHMINSFLIIK